MRKFIFTVASLTLALSLSPAFAQDAAAPAGAAPADQASSGKTLTMDQAMAMLQGSLKYAAKDGSDVSIVILDRDKHVLLQARGDLASPHNLGLAERKAITAITFKMPSLAWEKKTLSSDPDHERDMPDVIPLGGGVPIMDGDDVIGAIAASGTKGGQPGDEACAMAGAAVVMPAKVAGN